MPHRIFKRLMNEGDDRHLSDLWVQTQQLTPDEVVALAPIAFDRAKDATATPALPVKQRRRTILIAQLVCHRLVFEMLGLPPHPNAPLDLDTIQIPFF